MADVAALAGVSKATVSRVLSGAPGVSEETRTRIKALVKDLSYVVSPDASRLSRGSTGRIAVVMPHTTLERASVSAERVRSAVERSLDLSVSGGLSQALDGDNGQTLLSRARAALYTAKSAGRNCVFRHTGRDIEFILDDEPATVGHSPENF